MEHIIIGVDPHKLSVTIEVVDHHEELLGSGRFTTDRTGYGAMRNYAGAWPERVSAVEGSNGAGRSWRSAYSRTAKRCGRPGEARRPSPAVRHRSQPQDRRP